MDGVSYRSDETDADGDEDKDGVSSWSNELNDIFDEDEDMDGVSYKSDEIDDDGLSAGEVDEDLNVEESALSDSVVVITVGSTGLAVVVVAAVVVVVVDCPFL